jgi:hypothetical protein
MRTKSRAPYAEKSHPAGCNPILTEPLTARLVQLVLSGKRAALCAAHRAVPSDSPARISRFCFTQDACLPWLGVNASQPNGSRGRCIRRRAQFRDQPQDVAKQMRRNAMADDLRADLDQLLLQAR